MLHSRREFIAGAAGAAAIGITPQALPVTIGGRGVPSQQEIVSLFKSLPGDVAIKIYAPATGNKPEFMVQSNASKVMFVGSAFKSFVLCEALRQADSPTVTQTIAAQQLALDASVWSLDSATFNPPNLIGKVSLRTALEAMILHSDNTATDMCLKHVGADKVRELIASMGLRSTMIPDSTRVFFGYLLGAKDYKNFTWEQLGAAANQSMANKPLNNVTSMSSSADDFVSYYSRALQGRFFKNPQTLSQFRQILSTGDAIWRMPMPLGASAFTKGGSIDVPGFHAVCVPGGMFFDDRWVYFCLTVNWTAAADIDPGTMQSFAEAAGRALAMVKEAVSA